MSAPVPRRKIAASRITVWRLSARPVEARHRKDRGTRTAVILLRHKTLQELVDVRDDRLAGALIVVADGGNILPVFYFRSGYFPRQSARESDDPFAPSNFAFRDPPRDPTRAVPSIVGAPAADILGELR